MQQPYSTVWSWEGARLLCFWSGNSVLLENGVLLSLYLAVFFPIKFGRQSGNINPKVWQPTSITPVKTLPPTLLRQGSQQALQRKARATQSIAADG